MINHKITTSINENFNYNKQIPKNFPSKIKILYSTIINI